jgi:DNA (cytosine-5)-methyltransferase 1
MENVAGITSEAMVHHLDAFVEAVEHAGYEVLKPIKVLNAVDFGVPQRRRRVFVIGWLTGEVAPTYPPPSDESPSVWDALGDLPDIEEIDYLIDSDIYKGELASSPSPYAAKLRATGSRLGHPGLSGFLRTNHSAATRARFAATTPGTFEPVSRFYRLSADGTALTLRAGSDRTHGAFTAPRPIHPIHARCISVREAARLHGFPDDFSFDGTKWHGFRQIGNAVPPPLAESVAVSVRLSITDEVTHGE